MKFVLVIIIFAFTTFANAQTALTKELLKYEIYKNIYDSIKGDEQLSNASNTIQEALAKQKDLEANPTSRAKLFYQGKETAAPCSHCPKYLDLVMQVNTIVEKIEPSDIAVANEKLIQLTKLKFLYYIIKSNDPSNYYCNKYSPIMGLNEELKKGSVTLLAEKALALPSVTDVQIYDPKASEAHYFYQGEGEEGNTIIEVVIDYKSKSATMKYYRYDNGFNIPTLEALPDNPDKDGITLAPSIETENLVLPTDIKIGTAKSKLALPGGLVLSHKTDIGFNQQKTLVTLGGTSAEQLLVVEGINNSGGSKIGTAVVNMGFELDKDSGLKLGTVVGTKLETTGDSFASVGLKNNQNIELGLTDHNNEYFRVKTVLDDAGISQYSGSNKFRLGDGSVGSDITVGRDGDRSVGVTVEKQGIFNSVGARYLKTSSGERKYIASAETSLAKDTILKTEYSKGDNQDASVALNFERKISETTSMVLTVNSSTGSGGTSFLYQFQSKL